MDRAHEVKILAIDGPRMQLRVDGKEYAIDLNVQSRRLAQATQQQREKVEVSPTGYGLHWPELDEDLSIDGLLGIKHHAPFIRHQS